MKILTWNVNSFRSLRQYHPWTETRDAAELLDRLDADIVCLQEHKLTRSGCPRDFCLPENWDTYAAFSRAAGKTGYSGVSTHVRVPAWRPVAAEASFTGLDGTWLGGGAGCESLADAFPEATLRAFDGEGRCVATDHGLFVLLNVYCPNEAGGERLEFKMAFHRALALRIERLVSAGRHVVLAGDLNVCHQPIDHCDPAQMVRERGIASFEDTLQNAWFRGQLAPAGPLYDLFRRFHPDQRGAFTCWNTKINARPANYGTRIDYVMATGGLLPWASDCVVQPDVMGSDHCPVVATFFEQHPVTGERLEAAAARGVEAPPLCARNWKEFRNQANLRHFFAPAALVPSNRASRSAAPQGNLALKKGVTAAGGAITQFFASPSSAAPAAAPLKKPETDEQAAAAVAVADAADAADAAKAAKCNASSAAAWSTMFAAKKPPVCYHNEPCRQYTVNKAGPNRGRQFFMCARHVGPSDSAAKDGKRNPFAARPASVGEYRCDFFQWKSKSAPRRPRP